MYTNEKNALILIALLKEYGIRRVIASPGTTNIAFVRSVQADQFFDVYSCVDERSAAYMAVGMASETGEPVVISCTGATASRNYLPGLTEAYYRKLPIIAITSSRDASQYGHLHDQVIDRTVVPVDSVKTSVHLQEVKDAKDLRDVKIKICKAITATRHFGGGPVHLNLTTTYDRGFSTLRLPNVNPIKIITLDDEFPQLPEARIGIFIGSHRLLTENETTAIEAFCEMHDAVIFCDHTSGYNGKYAVNFILPFSQLNMDYNHLKPELLIHVGEISAVYQHFIGVPRQVWRVSSDGQIRDTFTGLKYLFEMSIVNFFSHYHKLHKTKMNYFAEWSTVPVLEKYNVDLPFSNLWMARDLHKDIPNGSRIHFAILNSLTSWNYFKLDPSLRTSANVGGFGIDGTLSTLIGAALASPKQLFFCIVGDLAFFYDMNVLGNRHMPKNIRILLVNNGKGMEFKMHDNPGMKFGDETDTFISAAGHFGNKSRTLVKYYCQALGIEYLCVENKEDFAVARNRFLDSNINLGAIVVEAFVDDENERVSHEIYTNISSSIKGSVKTLIKRNLPKKHIEKLKVIRKKL